MGFQKNNQESSFVFANGKVASDLAEFSSCLEELNEHHFNHHVNESKNDFANWIGYILNDDILKNQLTSLKDKHKIAAAVKEILNAAEAVAVELPPDIPPQIDEPKEVKPTNSLAAVESIKKNTSQAEKKEVEKTLTEFRPTLNDDEVIKIKKGEVKKVDKDTASEVKQIKKEEQVVELRKIETKKLGVKEIDRLFKKGLPTISNILFAGKMSTGKTNLALKILIEAAKRGENTAYISLLDTEEKIINVMAKIDQKALDYINSGHINIKRIDVFDLSHSSCEEKAKYLEDIMPSIIVIDSISALELSFEKKIEYRHYLNCMFKTFEKFGLIAIFIKELEDDTSLNMEFFENMLADGIIHFKPYPKVVKYPMLD